MGEASFALSLSQPVVLSLLPLWWSNASSSYFHPNNRCPLLTIHTWVSVQHAHSTLLPFYLVRYVTGNEFDFCWRGYELFNYVAAFPNCTPLVNLSKTRVLWRRIISFSHFTSCARFSVLRRTSCMKASPYKNNTSQLSLSSKLSRRENS